MLSDKPTALGLTEVSAAYDYYPGGMIARSENSGLSRHTYNGKEYDRELRWQEYGERMYNPNLIRFPTVDPKYRDYPNWSPYNYAGNNPIAFIDREGENPVAKFLVKMAISSLIKFKAEYEIGKKIGDASDRVHMYQERVKDINYALSYLTRGEEVPKECDDCPDLFKGGDFSGGGAGGQWGGPMTEEEKQDWETKQKQKVEALYEKNPRLKEKIEKLQAEKLQLEKDIIAAKKEEKNWSLAQEVLRATRPDKILESIGDGINSLTEIIKIANEKLDQKVEKTIESQKNE